MRSLLVRGPALYCAAEFSYVISSMENSIAQTPAAQLWFRAELPFFDAERRTNKSCRRITLQIVLRDVEI